MYEHEHETIGYMWVQKMSTINSLTQILHIFSRVCIRVDVCAHMCEWIGKKGQAAITNVKRLSIRPKTLVSVRSIAQPPIVVFFTVLLSHIHSVPRKTMYPDSNARNAYTLHRIMNIGTVFSYTTSEPRTHAPAQRISRKNNTEKKCWSQYMFVCASRTHRRHAETTTRDDYDERNCNCRIKQQKSQPAYTDWDREGTRERARKTHLQNCLSHDTIQFSWKLCV